MYSLQRVKASAASYVFFQDYGVAQGQLPVFEFLQIPQHCILDVVRVEDFMLQKPGGSCKLADVGSDKGASIEDFENMVDVWAVQMILCYSLVCKATQNAGSSSLFQYFLKKAFSQPRQAHMLALQTPRILHMLGREAEHHRPRG
ncbi:hypothetical protein BSKO_09447 [Bryopsis sp. KO-2023]|nr:hypothetical protein BSKO_09447 [Bryopsis sp. KO-2023]